MSKSYSEKIKAKAVDLGFSACGISKADFLETEAPRLENWLKNSMNGQMHYMSNHFDKRLDPRLLVEGAKSVISLAYNYFPAQKQNTDAPQISKYAYGEDYHSVVKDKLKALYAFINEEIGEIEGRFFTDSAPVMERAWAQKSGLGWIGKNGNLILPQQGSFHFLAELIIDLELSYDTPIQDYCGTCTRCIDACPTGAIYVDRQVDGSKCISYFTIELRAENLPTKMSGKFQNWAFGCDICQDVCPHNRKSKASEETRFSPHPNLLNMTEKEWHDITPEIFSAIFRKSAVKRTKYAGLMRNIKFLTS